MCNHDHDHDRHDDDGFGSAVDHAKAHGLVEDDGNEDDLGPKWGITDEVDVPANPVMDAYKANESFLATDKAEAMAAIPNIVATAKAVLDKVLADPMKTRFILIEVGMENLKDDGTATVSGDIVQMGTIGTDFLVEYVQRLLFQNMASYLAGDEIGPAANKLEV